MDLQTAIARVVARQDLAAEEMAEALGQIMDGEATAAQIGALLAGLRAKGETVDEIVGAARAMRARALPVAAPAGIVVDTCGTGGDGAGTINVSTIAAIVVAAAGVPVAKHGNRALSSRAGSADLLEALGVAVAGPPAVAEQCLRELGIGFFYAPTFHAATRHAAAARREMGIRTIFNLLGPLTNPAGVRRQVVGVFAEAWCEPLAWALRALGSERALVVHGAGLDELSPIGSSTVAELRDGTVTVRRLAPTDFGLSEGLAIELGGGDARENALRARALLDGAPGGARTAVVMTAAAALYVAERGDFVAAARLAARAIDAGDAARLLDRWTHRSQELAAARGEA